MCGFNPVYATWFDPRIGCRVPAGISINAVSIFINGVQASFQQSNWASSNAIPMAQRGQMFIWSFKNNIQCVAWNPQQVLGPSDNVVVRLSFTNGSTIERLVVIQPFDRYLVNPEPIAHSCGFSPDGSKLRADPGDILSRFVLGYDLALAQPAYDAWWRLHGTYQLVAGRVYDVPAEWHGGVPYTPPPALTPIGK